MKTILGHIKGHNWEHGDKRGNYTTSHSQFYKFDYKGAKVAAIPLTEEVKNDLRYSHYELGKGNAPLSTTQTSSFGNVDNFKKRTYEPSLKQSSINFNPKNGNIKGDTIYMNDYTLKESME